MPLIVDIKAVPSAGKQAWKLDSAGVLKCYLKNPAERGLANDELIKRLAKALGIPQADVQLIAGAQSRSKKVKITTTISRDQLLKLLGIEQQMIIDYKE